MRTTRREAFEAPSAIARVRVIDSHTGGEPTRVVIDGGPDLGGGSMAERRERMRDRHDAFRAAVVNEPRGSEVVVGALLCEPVDPACTAGVIFFNNVGYLGMCGHGLCGLIVTLAHLGRIGEGTHRIETPVGTVEAVLEGEHRVTFANVPSYRHATGVKVLVPGIGPVQGDVAWGGNWFFLVERHGQRLARDNVAALTDYCRKIKEALAAQNITGEGGQRIDHIELFGPPVSPECHSRNFVLCPGDAFDRSPCGTGTSAKVACLVADGKLAPGEIWRQESLIGSRFEAWTDSRGDGPIVPRLRGTAYVCAEATLLFHPEDPLWGGIA